MSKYKDWGSWWDGLRAVAMKTGATTLSTQLTAFAGTNGVASLKIPGLEGIGENWRTALVATAVQFGLHTFQACMDYIKNKPSPDIIEYQTEIIKKETSNEKTTPTDSAPPTV